MPTITASITPSWQNIAADTDTSFSASWEATVDVEILTTATNVAPTGDGKKYRRENQVNRTTVGEGFVWARTSPGAKPSNITALVNATAAAVTNNPTAGTGTITTQNLNPSTGVATIGSTVEVVLNNATSIAVQTVGTYTGALSLQVTADGTNWVTLGGVPLLNVNTGGLLATITSALQGAFQANVGGFLKARITALAAMTGSVAVNVRAHQGAAAMVALDAVTEAPLNYLVWVDLLV